MFAIGVALYARAAPARDRTGSLAFWSLIAFLLAAYFGNAFGPPPPSIAAVAWTALGGVILVPWAVWIDRHREVETPAT